jgi:hypothetical protein
MSIVKLADGRAQTGGSIEATEISAFERSDDAPASAERGLHHAIDRRIVNESAERGF